MTIALQLGYCKILLLAIIKIFILRPYLVRSSCAWRVCWERDF